MAGRKRKNEGGSGGERKRIQETRMIERAIRLGWPISDDKRQALIDRQIAIALDKKASRREATSAFKAVVAANAQNLEAERQEKGDKLHMTGTVDQTVTGIIRVENLSVEDVNVLEGIRSRILGGSGTSRNGHAAES